MNYKYFLIIIFLILCSCSTYNVANNKTISLNKNRFQNKGFALVYKNHFFDQKIVSKKMDNRGLLIFQKNLKQGTNVKIKNILNDKTIIVKVGKDSKYPSFNNSVISERVSQEISLDLNEPYVEIIEI